MGDHRTEPTADVNDASQCSDSIAATLDVIGDRWTLLILRECFRGVRRFSDLADGLGIAKNLLSSRLRKLVAAGLLEKVPYQDRPVRYEYRLTPMGADLSPALIALMHWGDRWFAHGDPPTVLVHKTCGTPLEHAVTCPTCDATVAPGQIRTLDDESAR
ncbi:MAG: winged helix-turn-helix transcriptional regulator [Acidimicrobiales bacterium]